MTNNYFLKKLKPEEQLVAIKRRHGVVYFFSFLIAAVVVVADFFFLFWFLQHKTWGLIGFIVILFFGLIYGVRRLVIWYFYTTVVSALRILTFVQKGFFSKNQKECFFDKIEEVSYNKKGPIATIFNYGNIYIKTASESRGLKISQVKKPEEFKELIVELQQQNNPKARENQASRELEVDIEDDKDNEKIDWGKI